MSGRSEVGWAKSLGEVLATGTVSGRFCPRGRPTDSAPRGQNRSLRAAARKDSDAILPTLRFPLRPRAHWLGLERAVAHMEIGFRTLLALNLEQLFPVLIVRS